MASAGRARTPRRRPSEEPIRRRGLGVEGGQLEGTLATGPACWARSPAAVPLRRPVGALARPLSKLVATGK
ncbi:hypothetical protein P7K49_005811, partial [Saguinus oedipus]